MTGDLDAVLFGHFRDMEEYQALCDRLFDSDPDVVRYTTLFAVETYKDTTAITPSQRPSSRKCRPQTHRRMREVRAIQRTLIGKSGTTLYDPTDVAVSLHCR